ncbi:MAG: hypothetical protein WCD18_24965 [Thermosynechococcaceae cyanobacterium]
MTAEFETSLEVDVLAAALRMDQQETGDLLEFLAQKLELSLPQNTTIVRRGSFLSKVRPVQEITVRFKDYHYQIVREGNGPPHAKAMKLVRGVVLKTTEMPVDQWTEEVAQELAQLARQSTQTRIAISKFVLGGG